MHSYYYYSMFCSVVILDLPWLPWKQWYLDALQKEGRSDDSFEDEYYFTMPAISGIA